MATRDELVNRMKARSASAPLRSYLWRVKLPPLTIPQSAEGNYFQGDGINPSTEAMTHILPINVNDEISSRIASISAPNFMIDADKMVSGNGYRHFAKQFDVGTLAMDVYEYEDGLTMSYFEVWRRMIMNPNRTYNNPVVYKKPIVIYRLSASQEDLIITTYEDWFPLGLADITSDYDSSDMVKLTCSFQGDHIKHEIKPISGMDYNPTDLDILNDIFGVNRLKQNAVDKLESIVKSKLPPRLQSYVDANALSNYL